MFTNAKSKRIKRIEEKELLTPDRVESCSHLKGQEDGLWILMPIET